MPTNTWGMLTASEASKHINRNRLIVETHNVKPQMTLQFIFHIHHSPLKTGGRWDGKGDCAHSHSDPWYPLSSSSANIMTQSSTGVFASCQQSGNDNMEKGSFLWFTSSIGAILGEKSRSGNVWLFSHSTGTKFSMWPI